eukprot:4015661-Amphidinium_carterae.1
MERLTLAKESAPKCWGFCAAQIQSSSYTGLLEVGTLGQYPLIVEVVVLQPPQHSLEAFAAYKLAVLHQSIRALPIRVDGHGRETLPNTRPPPGRKFDP